MGQEQSAPKTLASSTKRQAAPAGAAKSAAPVTSPPEKKKPIDLSSPRAREAPPPSAAAKSSPVTTAAAAKKKETVESSPSMKEKAPKSEEALSKSSPAAAKPKNAASSPAPVLKQKTLAPVSAKSSASAQKVVKKTPERAQALKAKSPSAPPAKKRKLSDSSDDFQEEPHRKAKAEHVEAAGAESIAEISNPVWTDPKPQLAPTEDFFLLKPRIDMHATTPTLTKKLPLNPLVPCFVLGAYYRRKEIIAKYKGTNRIFVIVRRTEVAHLSLRRSTNVRNRNSSQLEIFIHIFVCTRNCRI
jgi:hypothetical protein